MKKGIKDKRKMGGISGETRKGFETAGKVQELALMINK
jgi:hypothetical protein